MLEGLLTSKQVALVSSNEALAMQKNVYTSGTHVPYKTSEVEEDLSASQLQRESALEQQRYGNRGVGLEMTLDELNDRLIESPKTRSYVPLLSKKLKKGAHESSENVLATASSLIQDPRGSRGAR